MTFDEFSSNSVDLKDEAVRDMLRKALELYLELDIEVLRSDLELGSFDFLIDIEMDDGFGTEGMNL